MVEKIIINPTKVRAYGNIIGSKDSTDYDTYNAYITEITDTVYGSTSNVFSMECEPHISLTATNPYLLSGETTDLVVSLVNEFGSPVSGKTVTLSDGTSVYTGITDSNGTYTKTGVSVTGDTTFTATYGTVSDSVIVEYCLFVDYGVTGKSNLSNLYYEGTTTVTDTGTLFECNNNNRWSIRPNSFGLFDLPIAIEFTVIDTSHRFAVQGFNSSTTQMFSIDTNNNINSGDEIRVEITSTTLTFYKNNVQLGDTRTYTSTSKMKFQVYFNQANTYLKYKDFRIKAL